MTELSNIPKLHGSVDFVDRMMGGDYPNPEVMHLCRDEDGNVLLAVDSSLAIMKWDDVKWLVSHLVAALDDWPVIG
jgi:hypothetical protein